MKATSARLTDAAMAYVKKKNLTTLSVDPPTMACCGVADVMSATVSKGLPKKDAIVYKKCDDRGVAIYYPYYTEVDGESIIIDAEKVLGITRLFVANGTMEI